MVNWSPALIETKQPPQQPQQQSPSLAGVSTIETKLFHTIMLTLDR
jgi:hypothetical protein